MWIPVQGPGIMLMQRSLDLVRMAALPIPYSAECQVQVSIYLSCCKTGHVDLLMNCLRPLNVTTIRKHLLALAGEPFTEGLLNTGLGNTIVN